MSAALPLWFKFFTQVFPSRLCDFARDNLTTAIMASSIIPRFKLFNRSLTPIDLDPRSFSRIAGGLSFAIGYYSDDLLMKHCIGQSNLHVLRPTSPSNLLARFFRRIGDTRLYPNPL